VRRERRREEEMGVSEGGVARLGFGVELVVARGHASRIELSA
jgi:hypothetical protein